MPRLCLAFVLLACGKGKTVATPAIAGITLGAAQQILQPGDLGLDNVPDVQLSTIAQGDGSHELWIGGSVQKSAGSVALLTTRDFTTFTPLVGASGKATPVFGASAITPCGDGVPGSSAFDAQYAAGGTVFPAANGADLLMIYHAENHTFGGSCFQVTPFYATIGLARSTDSGVTWTRQGAIISGRDAHPAALPGSGEGFGAAVPTAIVQGGFIYVFYNDYPVPGSGHQGSNTLMAARAPVASDGAPGSWQKWNNGSFSTGGLGGDASPIVTIAGNTCVFPRQPGVTYSPDAQQYLLTYICGAGWFFSTASSLDSQVWSLPAQFFTAPFDNQSLQTGNEYDWHLALVSAGQPSGQSIGSTGLVLFSRGGFPNTPIHMLWERPFALVFQ
jgi:hypothetical protein